MTSFDPRITAARADIAAAHLRGKVEAQRFVEGRKHVVVCGHTALRKSPALDSDLETELLFGQTFMVYDRDARFVWGQASDDDQCVGYVEASALREGETLASHRVAALATPLLPAPDAKRAALDILPMNAKVRVVERANAFARVYPSGFVFEAHLVPLSRRERDWVAIAEQFLRAPYVWGGKTDSGLDCSGLVQIALETVGHQMPRDTDLQEKAIDQRVEPAPDLSNLKRGDLVFWDGYVGIMLDRERLLHATSAFMQVVVEPVHDAVRRIEPISGGITSIRRVGA